MIRGDCGSSCELSGLPSVKGGCTNCETRNDGDVQHKVCKAAERVLLPARSRDGISEVSLRGKSAATNGVAAIRLPTRKDRYERCIHI